jgi:hypothetical protein
LALARTAIASLSKRVILDHNVSNLFAEARKRQRETCRNVSVLLPLRTITLANDQELSSDVIDGEANSKHAQASAAKPQHRIAEPHHIAGAVPSLHYSVTRG